MKNAKLQTFQLVCKGKPCSPWLTTTREYGRVFMEIFDESICSFELFKQESKCGEPLRVYHPGSRIGQYFDNNTFTKEEYVSSFIKPDSVILDKLYKYGLAKPSDFNFITVAGESTQLLRLYTPEQIELYIRSNIDRKFTINPVIMNPKQIKIRECDLSSIILADVKRSSKKLFDSIPRVRMTLSEIEAELGRKIELVSEK